MEQEAEFQAASQAALLDRGKRESKLRAELVGEATALAAKHEHQLAAAREASALQRKQEQHAIEERSHAHIQVTELPVHQDWHIQFSCCLGPICSHRQAHRSLQVALEVSGPTYQVSALCNDQ